MNPNLDLLDAVVAYVEAHPEQHDQGEWICGTAACVGGHAALMSGWKPYYKPTSGPSTSMVVKDGAARSVEDVARELLGLDWGTAEELFNGDNTLDDIRRIRDELHGEVAP